MHKYSRSVCDYFMYIVTLVICCSRFNDFIYACFSQPYIHWCRRIRYECRRHKRYGQGQVGTPFELIGIIF